MQFVEKIRKRIINHKIYLGRVGKISTPNVVWRPVIHGKQQPSSISRYIYILFSKIGQIRKVLDIKTFILDLTDAYVINLTW